MLYASTRNSLTKSLGSSLLTSSLFATSQTDLYPSSYLAHLKHMAAPKPLSAREQEMADIKAAEREAGGDAGGGSRGRVNHVGTGVSVGWSEDVETAVRGLAEEEGGKLVVVVSLIQFNS